MNKIFTILFLIALSFTSFSQVPDAISYQAIVRDGSGTVVKDKIISVSFSIIRVADDSIMVYREIHHPATDKTGLVSLMIGKGETADSFTSIDWGTGVYYLCTEMDINGGSDYSLSSICRMLSVPYALYAGSAQMVEGNSVLSLTNVLLSGNSADSLNIIGLSAPTDQQDIANKAYVDYIMQSLIPKTPISVPTAITKNADLSGSEVTLYGHVSSDGGADVVDRGFVYGTRNSMFSDTVSCGSGKGGFSYTISGFTSYEICNYKAYGTNNEGTCYGEAMSFVVPIPSVVTSVGMEDNGIGGMAIIYGIIESDGGSDIIARGFQYGTDPYDLAETIYVDTTDYNFSYTFTGLVPGATYYFRAFATNSNGTGYGELYELYNTSLPYVTTLPATDVLEDRATLHGTISYIGSEVTVSCEFIYSDTDSTCFTASDVNAGTTSGDFSVVLTGLRPNTTYYCRAEVSNDEGGIMGNVVSFTTQRSTTGQLSGHTWVDLGLPSGTRWATTNVGAENPEDYGDYYAWGETEPHYSDGGTTDNPTWLNGYEAGYEWTTYRYCNGSESTLTKYCNDESYGNEGFTDTLTTLESTDDAATANWGAGWRMPTQEELQELDDNCIREWTEQNGVSGYLFTGPNGNSIFLPAAGYRYGSSLENVGSFGNYWSSSLGSYGPNGAWYFYFYSEGFNMGYYDRGGGHTVRAVCDTTIHSTSYAPSVTTQSATEISSTSATLHATITFDGGADITSRGFMYGTDSDNLTESVQSTDETTDFAYTLTGLTPNTTYHYKAFATNSEGTGYGEVMSFTTSQATSGDLHGHTWVDLGLPSGLLWATTNVGAENPEDYGDYYAWGETQLYYSVNGTDTTWLDGYEDGYVWANYRYCNGDEYELTKYCNVALYGNDNFTDTLTILQATDDAATANWGTGWRMPTETESRELKENCDTAWTIRNNVAGMLFTSRSNGNSIFMPAAGIHNNEGLSETARYGNYLSSSLDTDRPSSVSGLYFSSTSCGMFGTNRCYGRSVRPVCSPSSLISSEPTITTSSVTNITSTSATLHATITFDGGADITSRGFIYGTDADNLAEIVQSTDVTTDFAYTLTGLTPNTTYYYKAFATNSEGTGYGEIMSFTTSQATSGDLHGHNWVDLGLPSGLLWATTNVGAENPEDYGDYYAWGETELHYSVNGTDTTWLNGYEDGYSWTTYRYCNGSESTLTKYCNDSEYGDNGFTDTLTTLESTDDAATANWGTGWRMPTQEELLELYDNCIREWTEQNGVNGYLFTGSNGNSIFLPATGGRDGSSLYGAGSDGNYWSSSLSSGDTYSAWGLYFTSGDCGTGIYLRCYGRSVRAVCQSQN